MTTAMDLGSRSVVDRFGSAVLHLFGGTGKRHVLLLCPLEHGQAALEVLKNLPPFKGRISLAVLPEPHSTPILALLADLEPSVVIGLDATQPLSSGEGVDLEVQTFTASTGLEYQHGGVFPAWNSGLLETAHGTSLLGAHGMSLLGAHGMSLLGCVAASVHRAVLACAVADVPALLGRMQERLY
jgi:hypothetical protein